MVFGQDDIFSIPFPLIRTMVVLVVICAAIAAAYRILARLYTPRNRKKRLSELAAMTATERRAAQWEALTLEQRLAAKAEEDFRKEVRDGYYSETYLRGIEDMDPFHGMQLRARVKMALAEMDAARAPGE